MACGCETRRQPAQSVAPAPAATTTPQPSAGTSSSPIPSSQATGSWNQSQVETYLKEQLKLSELSLTSAGGENYTGSGKGTDGQSYTMNVKQVPGGIACEFRTDTGGGRISFGNLVP